MYVKYAKEFDNINTDAIINEFILNNNWRSFNVCHIII